MTFFGPFMVGEPSEEQKRAMENQHQTHQMQAESFRHDVRRMLFEELTIDQLKLWQMTFANFLNMPSKPLISAMSYHQGLVASALDAKGICLSCGKNHEEAILGAPESEPVQKEFVPPEPGDADGILVEKSTTAADARVGKLNINEDAVAFSIHERAQMAEYGLDTLYDPETKLLVGFYCTRCKQKYRYPSIQDRMLRDADKCLGCIHEAKWG